MAHIVGRIIKSNGMSNYIFGYVVQQGEGKLTGVSAQTILSNPQEFTNVEVVNDKIFGSVLREKGINDDLINYWTIENFESMPIRFSDLIKVRHRNLAGSLVLLSKNQIGYTILTLDGAIINVSEKKLVDNAKDIVLYNAMIRGNGVAMKANYDIPDFSIKAPTCSAQDIIVLDTETTGVCKYRQDEVLQLSIINGTGKTIWNKYYKPDVVTEWAEAMNVNHITPEMVANAPSIKQDMKEINAILGKAKLIVGYNTTFDMDKILAPAGAKWSCPTVDVMRTFAPIYGELSPYGAYKWKNLITCANYFGYNWGNDNAHDGAADCRATLHCYKLILKL